MAMIDMDPGYDPGATTTFPGQRGGAPQGANASGPSNPYAGYFGQGAGIAGAYKKYLGRDISGSLDANDPSKLGEYQSWLGNQGYEEGIKNSGEAQAYAARQSLTGGGNGAIAPSGQWVEGGGAGFQQPGGGQAYGGTSVFDDPATKNFEKLLNDRIQGLQTPFQNPDYQPAVDQLHGYMARLNGPVYTDNQRDLMQTQTLDPMEHQRSQAKQQVMQRLAARGIGPSSGILEKALEDVDNQFQQLRTRTQAGFATNEIHQGNQNAASAAQLAPLIASMQQQNFNQQDSRNQQAVGLAQTIPNMAWARLTGAANNVQAINPLSALSLQNGFQQQGYGQDANFMQSLMPILLQLFGGG